MAEPMVSCMCARFFVFFFLHAYSLEIEFKYISKWRFPFHVNISFDIFIDFYRFTSCEKKKKEKWCLKTTLSICNESSYNIEHIVEALYECKSKYKYRFIEKYEKYCILTQQNINTNNGMPESRKIPNLKTKFYLIPNGNINILNRKLYFDSVMYAMDDSETMLSNALQISKNWLNIDNIKATKSQQNFKL